MSKAKNVGLCALAGCALVGIVSWYRSDHRKEMLRKSVLKKLDKLRHEYDELYDKLESMKKVNEYQNNAIRQFEQNCATEDLDKIYSKAYDETYH